MRNNFLIKVCILGLVFTQSIKSHADSSDMRIVNIRVGQGDSTLIQGPVTGDNGERINVLLMLKGVMLVLF